MSHARVPAHLEIGGLLRAVDAAGGFAMVLAKGDRDAGTIGIVTRDGRDEARLWERLPQADGARAWIVTRTRDHDTAGEFDAYLTRRAQQDGDFWLIELDIADPERFIAPRTDMG